MILNMNNYFTQLLNFVFITFASTVIASFIIIHIANNPYSKSKILDQLLFGGDWSKARAWIINIPLKLIANTQFFLYKISQNDLYQQLFWELCEGSNTLIYIQ